MPLVPNSPSAPIPGAASRDLASLLIRVMAGLSMILYNAWLMVEQGWGHLWHQQRWVLLEVVTGLGFPAPLISACVLASAFFLGSIFLILGVFGRIISVVLLVLTAVGLYFAIRGGAIAYVELALLYGTLYLLHILLGSGRYSLDQLFVGLGRRRFRRRNPAEF